ncbi:MAG: type II toxin-antitoxin system death-on-curing family toxin [Liquorilactobacillus sp.]|uniref:type II toxin-antitoxin system death-on-curing family toxin n=1 Tax=Liquorilactobacillus nagelii TaxID=82688 RepID=UPI0039ECAE23
MAKNDLDGVLFLSLSNRKQLYEFKKIFARSVNLSNVDAKRWKLTLRKYGNHKDLKILKLYFDNELIDSWAIVKVKEPKVTLMNLKTLNERAEKMFKEEWMYGIKDKDGLESLIASVDNGFFGIEPYPTIILKAAHFWYVIATKQMFHNGNKRTALLTALFFLEINGYKFKIKDRKELYNISLRLANKNMSEKELVDYIGKNTLFNFELMDHLWNNLQIN